ncbi:MAG TPA: tRNA 4-thiouridine(8) synthase ThiI [Candidatus Portnoybacteria bacterium]|nr:tRNA 4-thiouridine(8) synthase ThiI [Candidatus Portnoybacteria bacterium]
MIRRKKKALVLFSGGLDSILAVKILQKQKINVVGIAFSSYFFNTRQAKKSAQEVNIPLKIIYLGSKYLKIVRQPKFGYGSGINPCLDCRILMLREAKRILEKEKFNFIATGEVLGQRPMTQNKQAIKIIEEETGLVGYILRPLSAKLFPPTISEKEKIVARETLFDIRGRSRKKQIELAKEFNITDYPSPAGGCILTEKDFAQKLKHILSKKDIIKSRDIKLLRLGRHFWTNNDQTEIILGRNHQENLRLKQLVKSDEKFIEPKFSGPSALIRGIINQTAIDFTWKKIKERSKNHKGSRQLTADGRKQI